MSKKVVPIVLLVSIMIGALGTAGSSFPSGQNTPSYTSLNQITLPLTLRLLGTGAKWAANNGSEALFVNWKDNWLAHHLTDGSTWGPWPEESEMDDLRFSIYHTLSQSGLNVEFAGDIPKNLSRYDVVVIDAYWSIEPRHEPLIRNYVLEGGGVVLLGGVPALFCIYCKDWWPSHLGWTGDMSPIQEWFGAGRYNTANGYVNVTVDNPFGTSLLKGDILFEGEVGDYASVNLLQSDAQIIAQWQNPLEYRRGTFSFTHEYGQGRVYFQSAYKSLSVVSYENEYVFAVESNSTISALEFTAENAELTFAVTGPNGTSGYIRVTIAKSLISEIEGTEIKLDGKRVDYTTESSVDSWILFFTYQHSTHKITISLGDATADSEGMQFKNVTIIVLFLVIVVLIVVLYLNIKKDTSFPKKTLYR